MCIIIIVLYIIINFITAINILWRPFETLHLLNIYKTHQILYISIRIQVHMTLHINIFTSEFLKFLKCDREKLVRKYLI